jgi:dipeptidyl aminopeptidase/acylaminoacyl peptidase
VTEAKSARVLHAAVNPKGRPMTSEDIWRIPRVGAPSPFSDGTKVVFPVTTYDIQTNEGKTRLWVADADGAASPRPLTSPDASASSPTVSPDGRRIAFLRKTDKAAKAQLHVMPTDGGEAEKLTDLPLGVCDPKWFPDGRRIAFLSPLVIGHLTPEATKERLAAIEKEPVKARVTENRLYRYWDHFLTGGEVHHIFVLDVETKALTDLTPDSERWFELMEPDGQYDISPDGAEIAFSANASLPPHQVLRWALYTVPAAGGETVCLTPDHPADDVRPRYSPDGKSILYGIQTEPFFYADRVRLVRYDRASRSHTVLTEAWDRSAAGWEYREDGSVVLQSEDEARISVFTIGAKELATGGGRPHPVAGASAAETPVVPRLVVRGGVTAGLATANGRIFYTKQALSAPAELAVAKADGTGEKLLTNFSAGPLSEVSLGEVHEVELEGAKGGRIQMFVVHPPGFDPSRKWPLVHVIHGGPHSMSADQFHMRWNAHMFASAGYVVATVNFHGSTSWGEEFAKSILGGWGERPGEDIDRATDWLVARGYIDERRMAITGGSYGGYLVAWIATQTNRYAAIVNHAGVYNLLSQYASDVTQGRHVSFGGEPWNGLEKIERWNPASHIQKVSTPMLVIHGENDYRVPVTQGIEVYNVLKGKGVEARLVYYPDENHWILKPRNSIFWYREVHDWLARFLLKP